MERGRAATFLLQREGLPLHFPDARRGIGFLAPEMIFLIIPGFMQRSPEQRDFDLSAKAEGVFLRGLLILGITLLVYIPTFNAGFIWDDSVMLTENSFVQSADGLAGIWSGKTVDYFPVTLTLFWLEWRIFGMDPAGYHIVNVLLHALGATLLWRVLLRLGIPGAWLAGILFAVHPVAVGSVAWISEQKNTLSLTFYLLTILSYLRFEKAADEKKDAGKWYLLSLGCFLLALLSKTSTVILPLVLWLCTWWQSAATSHLHFAFSSVSPPVRRALLRTLPYFALSLIFGLTTIWFQTHRAIGDAGGSGDSLVVRVLGGSRAVWFYFWKAIAPVNLSMVYPRWTIDPASAISWLPVVAWPACLYLLWRFRNRIGSGWFFALAYFWVTLWPVMGVFDMYFLTYAQAADHWQYLALPGICGLFAAAIAALVARRQQWHRPLFRSLIFSVAACTVVLFSTLSWQRSKVFLNSETLWRDALKKNPRAWVVHNNLGNALEENGKSDEALLHHVEALRWGPQSPDTHYNMAKHFTRLGKIAEAEKHYRAALDIAPNYVKARNNLGILLEERGQTDDALAQYAEAVRLLPTYAVAHNNLSQAFLKKGKVAEALAHGLIAVRLKTNFPEAHYNVANAYSLQHNATAAVRHYQEALRLRPDYPNAHYNLGNVLVAQGNIIEARGHFLEAVRLRPNFADALNNLGNTFAVEGKWREASESYSAATRIHPAHAEAWHGLGFSLLNLNLPEQAEPPLRKAAALNDTFPEGHLHLGTALLRQNKEVEAVEQFQRAIQLKPQMAEPHFNLGMIRLATGDDMEAAQHFRQALKLRPGWREPANNLAWLLATSSNDQLRNASEAVELATQAKENNAASLDTLAAALAESKNFQAAIETAEQSLKLARESGIEKLASDIANRLELYRIGKPFRERSH